MSYDPNLDFNNAETGGGSFELIPDGTVAKLRMTIRPGGEGDGGWLTASKSSDASYLNAEFVVLEGQFAKRKFWQNLTVSGGKLDEKGQSIAGNITRANLRAMLESSRNIKPTDESDEAKKRRVVTSYGDFNGMEFTAKIGVQKGTNGYKDKNQLQAVITPDRAEYQGGGQTAQPAPSAAWTQPKPSNGAARPAWAQ